MRKRLVDRPDADATSYQILALLYKATGEVKECDKLYKAGIKRFPQSGVLLNEYGEMLWAKQDYSAIKLWEKGIEIDPGYSGNYYNAAEVLFPYAGQGVGSDLWRDLSEPGKL